MADEGEGVTDVWRRKKTGLRNLALTAAAGVLAMAAPAAAGPPYVTDDPEPTDLGHWEVYGFVSGTHFGGETDGDGGLDINYGAAPDLQLTFVLPTAYEKSVGRHLGFGDIEAAVKYRFMHQSEGSLAPDVAFFPAVSIPTASHRVGSGHWNLILPFWAQKDFGDWSVFGGGAYTFNPGAGNKDYWDGGLSIAREITKRFSLGAEIYHHTAEAVGAHEFTGMNVGATYKVSEHWSVLAAGGPGLSHPEEGGRYGFYLALKADY